VNKLLQTLWCVIAGLVVITIAGPTITKLTHSLPPLVLVAGIVAAALKWVWWYTR
jgi:hypothetical protein